MCFRKQKKESIKKSCVKMLSTIHNVASVEYKCDAGVAFFGGLLLLLFSFVAMIVVCGDWIIFHPPFVCCECDFLFFGRKTMGKDTHISINEKQNRPENVEWHRSEGVDRKIWMKNGTTAWFVE